jgi:prophage regulatory protein
MQSLESQMDQTKKISPQPAVRPSERRLLRLPAVMDRVGGSRAWVYREAAAGRFPKPIKRGSASLWDSAAIDAYIAQVAGDIGKAAA